MPPLKLVLDTNVYIQSLMRPGSFLDVLIKRMSSGELAHFYISPEILQELRDKVEEKFGFSPQESFDLIVACENLCAIVRPIHRIHVITSDPDDNKILECAISAKVDLIVSADRDLLSLKQYEGIKIVHPSSLKYLFPNLEE